LLFRKYLEKDGSWKHIHWGGERGGGGKMRQKVNTKFAGTAVFDAA